jgi:hypothetical protein
MFSFVSGRDKSHARIVAQPRLFDLHELGDLGIRRVEFLEFFKTAGPHARLIEGTVIGKRVLMAAGGDTESTDTEKQGARFHSSILAGDSVNTFVCAVGGTCSEGQVQARANWKAIEPRGSSDLEYPLDPEDA